MADWPLRLLTPHPKPFHGELSARLGISAWRPAGRDLRGYGRAKLGMSSRGSRVEVMETSKDWPGDDRSGGAERTRSRRMQIQTSVGAIAVVVSRELPEQPDHVALVDHDDVVQASYRAPKAKCDRREIGGFSPPGRWRRARFSRISWASRRKIERTIPWTSPGAWPNHPV